MPAGCTDAIVEWESKGLSNENHSFSAKLIWMNNN